MESAPVQSFLRKAIATVYPCRRSVNPCRVDLCRVDPQKRHDAERTVDASRGDRQRLVIHWRHHRVERGIDLLDSHNGGLDQLERADGPGTEEVSQGGSIQTGQLGEWAMDLSGYDGPSTFSIHVNAAVALGKPRVGTASVTTCRISDAVAPASSARRTSECAPPSTRAPTASASLISSRVLSSRGPACAQADLLAAVEADHRYMAPAADVGEEEIHVDPGGQRLRDGMAQARAVVAFDAHGADGRFAQSGRLGGRLSLGSRDRNRPRWRGERGPQATDRP